MKIFPQSSTVAQTAECVASTIFDHNKRPFGLFTWKSAFERERPFGPLFRDLSVPLDHFFVTWASSLDLEFSIFCNFPWILTSTLFKITWNGSLSSLWIFSNTEWQKNPQFPHCAQLYKRYNCVRTYPFKNSWKCIRQKFWFHVKSRKQNNSQIFTLCLLSPVTFLMAPTPLFSTLLEALNIDVYESFEVLEGWNLPK